MIRFVVNSHGGSSSRTKIASPKIGVKVVYMSSSSNPVKAKFVFQLELPSCLPSVSFRGRPIMERKVLVRPRDPVSRLWPVIYHEKQGIKVLASGWEAFCKANRIHVGDECAFEIEDVSECIYEVSVDRK
ncbi:hypothetical protein TEA_008608 [Camellia sinensis var. sinensis]|uniref:TF-B3 domain-containing protein n=1 Tax=Camellia sinensis var. sinensis TaxID=542762 RepID=A0A4S4EAM3_CAMSN|nr:hypothetical protein TEA_008608 [Camellia sinensis var. sinensis]